MRREMWKVTLLLLALLVLSGCDNKGGAGNASGTTTEGSGTLENASKDTEVAKAVQDKLDAEAALKTAGIKATAKNAQVELTGTVKSIADKDKAEQIAAEAIKPYSGVNAGVVNNIVIAESEGSGNAEAPGDKP